MSKNIIKFNNGKSLDITKPAIMGILNITPDSFSDGGTYFLTRKAIQRAIEIQKEGAHIIDFGAQSTRPKAIQIGSNEELRRIIPVLKGLKGKLSIPISIDTSNPKVAHECLVLGASIINDITGLQNDAMAEVIKKNNAAVIIMHMQGTPKTMQDNPHYKKVVSEIYNFLKKQLNLAHKKGIKNVMIDPGIGFGKTTEHNLMILNNIKTFKSLGVPIVIGVSRKSFIGDICDTGVEDRLPGTISSNIYALLHGAQIIRVHDIKEHVQVLKIMEVLEK